MSSSSSNDKSYNIRNYDLILNDLNSSKIKELIKKGFSNPNAFSSLLNLNLKFINNISMQHQNLLYNRIEVSSKLN